MDWLKQWFLDRFGRAPPCGPEQAERLALWQYRMVPDLDLPHDQSRYVVVDVESSGLNLVKDRLIAIGAMALEGGVIRASGAFEIILRQDEASDRDNILVHGIGGTAQREGREPAQALLDFLEFVGKAPLVAYHAHFDETMIKKAMRQYLGRSPDMNWLDLAWILPEFYDIKAQGRVALDHWLLRFGIENIQRHNALADCLATGQLLQVLLARAREKGHKSPRALMEVEKTRRWLGRSG